MVLEVARKVILQKQPTFLMNDNRNIKNGGCFTTATHYHLEESHSTSQERKNIEGGCEHIIVKKAACILSEANITTGDIGCFPNSNTQINDEAHQQSPHTGFANAIVTSMHCESTMDSLLTRTEEAKNIKC